MVVWDGGRHSAMVKNVRRREWTEGESGAEENDAEAPVIVRAKEGQGLKVLLKYTW